MEIAKVVTVTALFFIAILLLTSGRALGADPVRMNERQRAILADEAEELRRADTREAMRTKEPARAMPRRNFERLCVVKPVMADQEIEACRISYQHPRKDI